MEAVIVGIRLQEITCQRSGFLKVLGKQEIKPFFNFLLQSLPSPCLLLNGLYLVTGEGLSGFLLNRQATLLVFFAGPAWAGDRYAPLWSR